MIAKEIGVDIAAVGVSSRLRETIESMGFSDGYPKHLLPIGHPEGETLLGRIVRQGLEAPISSPPIIYANTANVEAISHHDDIDSAARIEVEKPDTQFGPFMRTLIGKNMRTLGATGDHFVEDFAWADLLDHHDSNRFPVTFVVGQCIEVDEGLVYELGPDGRIGRFYRPERTSSDSLINIGLYVFDPAEIVLRSLRKVGVTPGRIRPSDTPPEIIANQLIEDGLLGAYVLPPNTSFNVNTSETYHSLLEYTASKVVAA